MALSNSEIQQFRQCGLLFPKRVLTPGEAAGLLRQLELYESQTGGVIGGKWRYKSHLVFPWINQLMSDERILRLVRCLLGNDLMIWTTHIYPKEAGDGRFISWHQDSAHWGLDSNQIVTVWVALTEVTRENGCMRMLAGSHHKGAVQHKDTWDPDNILTRGQTIDEKIDDSEAVWVKLQAGEASLHHVDLFHASKPNTSLTRRVGVALRYITPSARQTRTDVDYATLVSGEDRFGHFEKELIPKTTMAADAIAFHEKIADLQGKIYLADTDRSGLVGLSETNRQAK